MCIACLGVTHFPALVNTCTPGSVHEVPADRLGASIEFTAIPDRAQFAHESEPRPATPLTTRRWKPKPPPVARWGSAQAAAAGRACEWEGRSARALKGGQIGCLLLRSVLWQPVCLSALTGVCVLEVEVEVEDGGGCR